MSAAAPNVATSIRARLLNVAKAQGVDFNQVLVRFALERILYRLTQSPHADRFLLKGVACVSHFEAGYFSGNQICHPPIWSSGPLKMRRGCRKPSAPWPR